MKYRDSEGFVCDAVRLSQDAWLDAANEMDPEGDYRLVFIDSKDNWSYSPIGTRVGLLRKSDETLIAVQGDWVVQDANSRLTSLKNYWFRKLYTPVP